MAARFTKTTRSSKGRPAAHVPKASPVPKGRRWSKRQNEVDDNKHAMERARRERVLEQLLAEGYAPPSERPRAGREGSGFYAEAGRRLNVSPGTIEKQISRGTLRPNWRAYKPGALHKRQSKPDAPPRDLLGEVTRYLKKRPGTMEDMSKELQVPLGMVKDSITKLLDTGISIHSSGAIWYFETPQLGHVSGPALEIISRPDNTFCFGATGDNHLGNKQARLDVLGDLYDRFSAADAQAVFNTGNWIDGEARFNKHELHVHGMDNQLQYLAENYPRREGLNTYAVSGDDHEGWYAQREGVNIGRYAEMKMRDAGRDDWHDLGYMESHVRLVNANTGAAAILAVVHPGGGSAYATSYSVQKIIEALETGEKPAVGLYGHYHKLWAGNIRGVWCIQTGTTEDQTTFMRKNKLEAQVGGVLVRLEQDPDTGQILACTPQMIRYFVKGHFQNRWNLGGKVQHAKRTP